MSRTIPFVLLLAAACGGSLPYHCTATVSGTGTSYDGPYTCQTPPNATYNASTQAGGLNGTFFAPAGPQISFAINTVNVPVVKTYSDDTLATGEGYTVTLFSAGKALWQAQTGSHAVALDVTRMDGYGKSPLIQTWSELTGTLNATLNPVPDNNTATTTAKVEVTFY